jgi:hypothetical protein
MVRTCACRHRLAVQRGCTAANPISTGPLLPEILIAAIAGLQLRAKHEIVPEMMSPIMPG